MKTSILLSLLCLLPSLAQAAASGDWHLVMAGKKEGNSIRSIERKITTPVSRYTVGQITFNELAFKGEKNSDDVRELLKKEMKLKGLQETDFGKAKRFEGYQEDLRRQVIIFVSFPKDKIKVSSAFYRPTYGTKVALEIEFLSRKYHEVSNRVSGFKIPSLFSEAYAQDDCTKCAGNPMCLMLCKSANPTVNTTSTISVEGLDQIQSQISSTNTNLSILTQTVNSASTDTNTNWADTNVEINKANGNWAETNENIKKLDATLTESNAKIDKATQTFDEKSSKALEESQAWREMTKAQSDKAISIGEKMSDPNHLFKMATFSAAGAVVGATVANLAISGVSSAVSFLAKWITGKLKEEKQENILKEFAQAMKVYDESSQLAKNLEISIDAVLANLALKDKFKMDNSELLGNIQKFIIKTEFEIEDLKKKENKNECIDDLVGLNQKLLEFKSLAKILDINNPQETMCLQLKDMFTKIAEVEGVLQNARPNLIKAEDALNWDKSRNQNKALKVMDNIRGGDVARDTRRTQDKQAKRLYEQNLRETKLLAEDVIEDCRESLKASKNKINKKESRTYCESIIKDKSLASSEGLAKSFPRLNPDEVKVVTDSFKAKYVELGIDKLKVFKEQREDVFADFEKESNRHFETSMNLKDRIQLDPRVALEEMKAINQFSEKLMKEQAYFYTDGLKNRKAKFDEACMDVLKD